MISTVYRYGDGTLTYTTSRFTSIGLTKNDYNQFSRLRSLFLYFFYIYSILLLYCLLLTEKFKLDFLIFLMNKFFIL